MTSLTITLAASGALRVQVDAHSLVIPATEDGIAALVRILQARSRQPAAKLGTSASPTQAIIDAWLAQDANTELMLAGKQKRRKDIENRTGVRVRDTKDTFLNLEGIEL